MMRKIMNQVNYKQKKQPKPQTQQKKPKHDLRILFTGGGTGGHFFPILSIKQQIEKICQEQNIALPRFLLIGSGRKFKKMAQENTDIPYKSVLSGKIRRYLTFKSIFQNLFDFFKMPFGILQALWQVWLFMPDVVFGKGGFASVPIVLTAWIYRIPIIIHESDSIPGLANRALAKLAKKTAISYEEAKKYFPFKKIILTGNPIRAELLQGSKDQAVKIFNLDPAKQTILVLGGSQGARSINDIIIQILPKLNNYNLIHQYGNQNEDQIRPLQNLQKLKTYCPVPFLKQELKHAYAAADLIISRTGANILTEISALAKPCILIPLPTSSFDHQVENAMIFAQNDAGIILEQENLRPHILLEKINRLLLQKELAKNMGKHARELYMPDAGKMIGQKILKLAEVS